MLKFWQLLMRINNLIIIKLLIRINNWQNFRTLAKCDFVVCAIYAFSDIVNEQALIKTLN